MATATPNKPTAPSTTKRLHGGSSTPPPSITRVATARSAASPRVASSLNSSLARRHSSKVAPPSTIINGESPESLSISLKQETDQKEQLLVQLQNKEQTISILTTENENLSSSLHAAEERVNELYADQSRSEMEMVQRMDISEKLRAQVRELEKEKRDIQRRYNEQITTFEAERQSFYDNEQHLKSRIQSLTEARKRAESLVPSHHAEHDIDSPGDTSIQPPLDQEPVRFPVPVNNPVYNDPENEPAEMTALKLELSTLSTSYASLQSTLVLLQTQLVDLKRVNHELQEENESYLILLREKTLSGQIDLMKQVGAVEGDSEDDDEDGDGGEEESSRYGSIGRSTLDRVDEESGEVHGLLDQVEGTDPDLDSLHSSRHSARPSRKRTMSSTGLRGESLADLPITGPGLDLAAELGRAENKDILAGNAVEERESSILNGKIKKGKKFMDERKVSSDFVFETSQSTSDIDALRTEVKSLKDANKALSLYASKIIDRIISEEGFEHVLAVDYDKEPSTPATEMAKSPGNTSSVNGKQQSFLMGRSTSNPMPAIGSQLTTTSPPTLPNTKANRRSLSFDWKSFSIFNGPDKKPDQILRPLTLKSGTNSVTTARKLDTEEDEEDRRERERLNATMKLMGIQPSPQSSLPSPSLHIQSSPPLQTSRRFSLFGPRSGGETSEASSVHSNQSLHDSSNSHPGLGISNLTQEALEHAEAESSLAALDMHEYSLSAEIARGAGSGFTEIAPRSIGRRSKRSVGGSGSTVWSAGMSGTGDED